MGNCTRNECCNFNYMKPSEEDTMRIEAVRAAFKTCEASLRAILTGSRETSLVWTSLEQACMWATKGICLDGTVVVPNSEASSTENCCGAN